MEGKSPRGGTVAAQTPHSKEARGDKTVGRGGPRREWTGDRDGSCPTVISSGVAGRRLASLPRACARRRRRLLQPIGPLPRAATEAVFVRVILWALQGGATWHMCAMNSLGTK